jgi:hypothetical protein
MRDSRPLFALWGSHREISWVCDQLGIVCDVLIPHDAVPGPYATFYRYNINRWRAHHWWNISKDVLMTVCLAALVRTGLMHRFVVFVPSALPTYRMSRRDSTTWR